MNKRIKKKYRPIKALERQLLAFETLIGILHSHHSRLYNRVCQLEKLVERNTRVTNERFDQLETENKELRQEIEDLKRQMKSKKSWFGRN